MLIHFHWNDRCYITPPGGEIQSKWANRTAAKISQWRKGRGYIDSEELQNKVSAFSMCWKAELHLKDKLKKPQIITGELRRTTKNKLEYFPMGILCAKMKYWINRLHTHLIMWEIINFISGYLLLWGIVRLPISFTVGGWPNRDSWLFPARAPQTI